LRHPFGQFLVNGDHARRRLAVVDGLFWLVDVLEALVCEVSEF
jgi:hypothetical protein